jgi:hypothetical protein
MRWSEIKERAPSGGVAPIKPLSPAQARERSKKTQRINGQISDARTKAAQRISDLQSRIASTR